MKIAYFHKYNKNSTWSQTQSAELKKTADSLAAKQLHNAAIGFHQFALHKNDSSIYQQALNAYRTYITIYPLNELANECHYNLAEIQFSLGSYKEAAEEYIAVSKRYPDSKYRETAAWNAIVASQNLLKEEKQTVKQ
jgi:TolA-binding protein